MEVLFNTNRRVVSPPELQDLRGEYY